MKTVAIILFMLAGTAAWGQKTETVIIHTSAECAECEARLEEGLNFTKGVVFAELDLESQNVTIKYSTKKTDKAKLKEVINGLGYDADEQKTTPEALRNLPTCCQPGGMEKEK